MSAAPSPASQPEIQKVLIANRGEIALRVMRTCREKGIRTVAVFSEADRAAPFVRYADEAYCIGPAPSAQSYLRQDAILEIAKRTGADAIHPGYGFLSENAEFSQACADAGVLFIGPSAQSIRTMGDKISAKQAARRFGVPMVPGTEDPIGSAEEAEAIATRIGYPVLIKASAGGGGKGMRVVERAEDLAQALQTAQSEARGAFGNDAVFMEKYVGAPRHIEIQLIADKMGNTVYLFERECSIQRRHQKLVEEAPSSCLTPDLRRAMGESAVAVAKACNYYGAGTVEFLVDESLNYYFLEMNTRLQVEHCVTEAITGVDLVAEQIRVAEGKPLSFSQEDLEIRGHAIELRVCAEDPLADFLPDTGILTRYKPAQGPGIRVDDGFEEGSEVPVYYDSMLAKLVAHAATREEAIERLVRAIDEYAVSGVKTTLAFGRWAVQHEAFRSGQFDTKFIDKYFRPELLESTDDDAAEASLAAHLAVRAWGDRKPAAGAALQSSPVASAVQASGWKRRFRPA